MVIQTKLVNGKYYCYATIFGYDHSFSGETIYDAQKQMRDLLERNKFSGRIDWEQLNVIEDTQITNLPTAPIGYAKSRIDNNPFG